MRFAPRGDDPDELADAVRRHVEQGAFWLAPAAYCTGLVSEILDVLRHPSSLRRDVAHRSGPGPHYTAAGRTAEGHLVHIAFHFEKVPLASAGSVPRAGFGSRLLVGDARCEAEAGGWAPAEPGARAAPLQRLK